MNGLSPFRMSLVSALGRTLIAICIASLALGVLACKRDIKEPSVAGTFYPADEVTLRNTVNTLIGQAPKHDPEGSRLLALVSPHAGYIYSGQVAAHSFKGLKGYRTVIIIGAAHKVRFNGASVYSEGAFRTPLGVVDIDEEFARGLIDTEADVKFMPAAFEKEHSIEVQIPFLQQTLGQFRIVPVLLGMYTERSSRHLIDKLTEMISERQDVLIVASTDLSHYHDYDTAVSMDRQAISSIKALSPEWALELLRKGDAEMCGAGAVLITMETARNLGATHGILHMYANSGDVTGDKDRVVGYASVGLYHAPLTAQELKMLIGIARSTIESVVRTGKPPAVKYAYTQRLMGTGGSFVTVNRKGQLRGCMGEVRAEDNLIQSVINSAVKAAAHDPRFPPMTPEELADMEVEVSVLSPIRPINARDIEVGLHGVMLVKGNSSSIFLPKVPVEQGWDRPTYLDQLSLKAGLQAGAWKSPDARLFGFTAEVITEH